MIILAYLGSQSTKFHAAGWTCWFLRPFIWSRVPGLMPFRDGSDKGTATMQTLLSRVIIGDGSWIYGYDPETKQQSSQQKIPNSSRPKEARQVNMRSQEDVHNMFIVSFDIKRLLKKNSTWQAKEQFLHTSEKLYGDCLKICEDR
jgi:hypothetical protein